MKYWHSTSDICEIRRLGMREMGSLYIYIYIYPHTNCLDRSLSPEPFNCPWPPASRATVVPQSCAQARYLVRVEALASSKSGGFPKTNTNLLRGISTFASNLN